MRKNKLFFYFLLVPVSILLFINSSSAQNDSTTVYQNQFKAILRGDSVLIGQLNDSVYIIGKDTLRLLNVSPKIAKKEETLETVIKNWKRKGSFNLNFSNVGLTNWAGGGQSAVSLGTILVLEAIRETDESIWQNRFNSAFGITKINGRSIRKSDDALIIVTQFSKKLNQHWSLANRVEIKSQIWEGIKYAINNTTNEEEQVRISNFLSPGRLEISSGLQYSAHKEEFRIDGMISPLSGKLTVVLDDSVHVQSFGIEEGKKVLSELGIQFTSGISTKFMQNVTFTNNLHLFANYLKIENIDVNWETLLVLKVSKYINTNFSTNLIYDDDINIKVIDKNGDIVAEGPRTQFKHVLNVGMNFIF